MLISFILFIDGPELLITGVSKIIDTLKVELKDKPGYIAIL